MSRWLEGPSRGCGGPERSGPPNCRAYHDLPVLPHLCVDMHPLTLSNARTPCRVTTIGQWLHTPPHRHTWVVPPPSARLDHCCRSLQRSTPVRVITYKVGLSDVTLKGPVAIKVR